MIDPLGGINTLWPLFGIANQMLAAIALTLCTVVLFKMKRERYAWVTIVPTVWLVVCTLTAGLAEGVQRRIRRSASSPTRAGSATPSRRARSWRRPRRWRRCSRIIVQRLRRCHAGRGVRRRGGGDGGLRRASPHQGTGQSRRHRASRSARCAGGQPAMTERCRTVQFVCEMVVQTARLMVGVPDYQTYVAHRAEHASGQADDELRGILPRAPERALRDRQGPVPGLLLTVLPTGGRLARGDRAWPQLLLNISQATRLHLQKHSKLTIMPEPK